jgi:hexosaminidase
MNLIPAPLFHEDRPGSCQADAPVVLTIDPSLPAEAYRLEIGDQGIAIACADAAGEFYARQTLAQLATVQGGRLAGVHIEDRPRFAWRGAMLDSCRSFQTTAFIKKFLDLMAYHKLNRFHWHLTDDQAWRLEIPALPELARVGGRRLDRRFHHQQWREGSYSPDDVREIVAYATARHITVVPEIETPGHAMAALASHPELSCSGRSIEVPDTFGIHEDVFCAGNDEVFALLGKVYDHVAAVFPGPWVHAGGDECPKVRWDDCPKCQDRILGEGLANAEALQGWFMRRVAGMLAAHGKTMVGWDEILEGGCPEDSVVMSWRGIAGGIEAVHRGHRVVMSPQTKACYLDHMAAEGPEEAGQLGVCTLADAYAFDPVPAAIPADRRHLILGGQANIWTELMYTGRQVEYMAFPRLCALAEAFWSPAEGRDLAGFRRRLLVHRQRLDALDVSYNPTLFRGPAGC